MNIFKRKKADYIVEEIKKSREEQIDDKYKKGLKKSRESLIFKIKKLATKHREINNQYFDELEEILILADLGVFYVDKILTELKTQAKIKKITTVEEGNQAVYQFLLKIYQGKKQDLSSEIKLNPERLNIILITGVNGVGKTTSIAKLAYYFKNQAVDVLLAAADSFRAGAVAQLEAWAKKVDVAIVIPLKEMEDPGAIVYRAIKIAKERKTNLLIIDTAGRLENKKNLMNELAKINKIILRETDQEVLENLLVIDATTGQNGVHQASAFNELLKLTGIILTKMDASAKGGIVLSIKDYFDLPVKFIGLGEGLDDLQLFNIQNYLDNLLGTDFEVV